MAGVNDKVLMMRQAVSAVRHQRGVAAIEFLLIMLVMLPAFYVATALAIGFVAQQSVTQAAAEGARAALRAGSLGDRETYAKTAAINSTQWPTISDNDVSISAEAGDSSTCGIQSDCTLLHVTVTVSDLIASLPGWGNLIPTQWTSSSVATLDNSTLTADSGDGAPG